MNTSSELAKLKQVGKNSINYLIYILPIKTVQEMEYKKLLMSCSYRIKSKPNPVPPRRRKAPPDPGSSSLRKSKQSALCHGIYTRHQKDHSRSEFHGYTGIEVIESNAFLLSNIWIGFDYTV